MNNELVAENRPSPMIPKRIVQFWGGGTEPPALCRACSNVVKLLNPDFEYVFLDDVGINAFLDREFPEYRGLITKFPFPIQRYDFLRYLIVYRMGGFYFDMDVLLASGLGDLLSETCVFPFERLTWSDFFWTQYGMDWEVGNYAFGATAEHPFLKAIIENCVRALGDKKWAEEPMRPLPHVVREELYVIYTTGPGMVTRTLTEYPEARREVRILFPENVCDKKNCWNLFGDYGLHLGGGSWRLNRSKWWRRYHNFFAGRIEENAIKRGRRIGVRRTFRVEV